MSVRKRRRNKKGVRALLVILSVKGKDGALVKLEYRAGALERDEAISEAQQAAERSGYQPRVLLDVIELYGGDVLIG